MDKAPIFRDRRPSTGQTTRKVYGMWYGGRGNYATPSTEDAEQFNSISHAKQVFNARYQGRDPISGQHTPLVGDDAEMHIFHGGQHPNEMNDPYPDRIIRRGKRGGTRVERA